MTPWHPITDPSDLKRLGKLAEEAGELCSAVSRCIIQGINAREPTTDKSNETWLEEEIADVLANIELTVDHFTLDKTYIRERIELKLGLLRAWHKAEARGRT